MESYFDIFWKVDVCTPELIGWFWQNFGSDTAASVEIFLDFLPSKADITSTVVSTNFFSIEVTETFRVEALRGDKSYHSVFFNFCLKTKLDGHFHKKMLFFECYILIPLHFYSWPEFFYFKKRTSELEWSYWGCYGGLIRVFSEEFFRQKHLFFGFWRRLVVLKIQNYVNSVINQLTLG